MGSARITSPASTRTPKGVRLLYPAHPRLGIARLSAKTAQPFASINEPWWCSIRRPAKPFDVQRESWAERQAAHNQRNRKAHS